MPVLGAFRSAFRSRLRPRFTSIPTNPHRRLLSTPPISLRQPYTWPTRLWYRQDGTPRSKKEGAIYVALALLVWYPYSLAVDVFNECELVYDLIHIRRLNSCYKFDLSQPNDIVEYFLKILRIDFDSTGKKHKNLAVDACLHILETFPETCTYIRSQLEDIRALTENDDVNQDTLKTAWAVWESLERIVVAFTERADQISSRSLIKEERQGSNSKDLYREVG